MIYIIFMAAGNSRRFGLNKLLYMLDGKPLYRHGLDCLLRAAENHRECEILVVSQYDEILNTVTAMGEEGRQVPLKALFSPESVQGASFTIKNALQYLQQTVSVSAEDYLMFMTADQPYISEETMKKVLSCTDEMKKGKYETASVYCGDIPGNPTLFSAGLIPELMELSGDQGGRRVIRKHSCFAVPIEDGRELKDIDVPEDLEKAESIYRNSK